MPLQLHNSLNLTTLLIVFVGILFQSLTSILLAAVAIRANSSLAVCRAVAAELWGCVAPGGLFTSSWSSSGTTRRRNGKTSQWASTHSNLQIKNNSMKNLFLTFSLIYGLLPAVWRKTAGHSSQTAVQLFLFVFAVSCSVCLAASRRKWWRTPRAWGISSSSISSSTAAPWMSASSSIPKRSRWASSIQHGATKPFSRWAKMI